MVDLWKKPLEFEWDDGNLHKSRHKHGVSTQEAEGVFYNEPLIIAEDIKHSANEQRYLALGKTHVDRRLSVVFTMRKHHIRIISARPMDRRERSIYEEA